MPLKGGLRDFSLPDLFQLIHFGKKNGTLVIANGDAMGYVCFRNGNVFFATHNWKRAPLGQRLLESGMVTREQLDEALELQNTTHSDQRVGTILVELGYLTRESLEVYVEEHIRDAVFNLLRWNEGDFDFDPDQIFPEEDIGLSMSTEDLIMEGSRRLDEWFQIEKKVPSLDSVFEMSGESGKDPGEMDLTSEERLVLDHVDGKSSVRDIIERSGQSALVACKALHGLSTAGLVTLTGDSAPAVCTTTSGLEDEVGQMMENQVSAALAAPADAAELAEEETGEVLAEAIMTEVEDRAERRHASRKLKKKQVEDEEVITFGDESDEGITIEEVTTGGDQAPAPRGRKPWRKVKKREEAAAEVVEEEAEQPRPAEDDSAAHPQQAAVDELQYDADVVAEVSVEMPLEVDAPATTEPETPVEPVPAGAPAPGQSLVDYYKSLAIKELGDSESYRETEDRRAFIEQQEAKADAGEFAEEDIEFEIAGSTAEEEPATALEEPLDIPLEWAGHLTRLRGRTTEPVHAAISHAEDDEAADPLQALEDEIEEAQPLEALAEYAEPSADVVAEASEEEHAGAEAADIVEEDLAVLTESDPGAPPEDITAEADLFLAEPEAPVADQDEPSDGMPVVPLLDETSAIDEADLPTEEDIERLLQVTPPARGELSREELLTFDQPTYPIVESREASLTPDGVLVAEETSGVAAEAGVGEAELVELVAPATAKDEQDGWSAAPGQVIQFNKAEVDTRFEVVLEQPDPLVTTAAFDRLSVAEDLQVPVLEATTGQAVPELRESEVFAEAIDDMFDIPLVHDEAEEALEAAEAARELEESGEETESVPEVVGLDEFYAEVIPLDTSRISVAEELEFEQEAEPQQAVADKVAQPLQAVAEEAELNADIVADSEEVILEEEEEEEEEEDFGLMGTFQVSGKRGAGTSLVDLETFELEQELMELAGGAQQTKKRVAYHGSTSEQQSDKGKKEKKGRGIGRSRGKEVDKGSVKKIIDDIKNK